MLLVVSAAGSAQSPIVLQCDKDHTTAGFTLSATFHTVHGTFKLKSCELRYERSSGRITGEIAFDATSGETGNEKRDLKMKRDVLESSQFPAISFRPDRVEGTVAGSGSSTVQVHGMFSLHGTDHELTVPVEVTLEAGRWSAASHFSVPYVKWGLKNPSSAFLHVGESVEAKFDGVGSVTAGSP
jgi:polyisoprenoid-binding protein YceI